jgi:hypothetical protein
MREAVSFEGHRKFGGDTLMYVRVTQGPRSW